MTSQDDLPPPTQPPTCFNKLFFVPWTLKDTPTLTKTLKAKPTHHKNILVRTTLQHNDNITF